MLIYLRHIYYQHQELFEKQAKVDELVDCLALTLGVNREDLNIVRETFFGVLLMLMVTGCGIQGCSFWSN